MLYRVKDILEKYLAYIIADNENGEILKSSHSDGKDLYVWEGYLYDKKDILFLGSIKKGFSGDRNYPIDTSTKETGRLLGQKIVARSQLRGNVKVENSGKALKLEDEILKIVFMTDGPLSELLGRLLIADYCETITILGHQIVSGAPLIGQIFTEFKTVVSREICNFDDLERLCLERMKTRALKLEEDLDRLYRAMQDAKRVIREVADRLNKKDDIGLLRNQLSMGMRRLDDINSGVHALKRQYCLSENSTEIKQIQHEEDTILAQIEDTVDKLKRKEREMLSQPHYNDPSPLSSDRGFATLSTKESAQDKFIHNINKVLQGIEHNIREIASRLENDNNINHNNINQLRKNLSEQRKGLYEIDSKVAILKTKGKDSEEIQRIKTRKMKLLDWTSELLKVLNQDTKSQSPTRPLQPTLLTPPHAHYCENTLSEGTKGHIPEAQPNLLETSPNSNHSNEPIQQTNPASMHLPDSKVEWSLLTRVWQVSCGLLAIGVVVGLCGGPLWIATIGILMTAVISALLASVWIYAQWFKSTDKASAESGSAQPPRFNFLSDSSKTTHLNHAADTATIKLSK